MAIALPGSPERRGNCGTAEDQDEGSRGGASRKAERGAREANRPPESRDAYLASQSGGGPDCDRGSTGAASAGHGGGRGRLGGRGRERLCLVDRPGAGSPGVVPRVPAAKRGGCGAPVPPPLPLRRLRGRRCRWFVPRLRAHQHREPPRCLLLRRPPHHHRRPISAPSDAHHQPSKHQEMERLLVLYRRKWWRDPFAPLVNSF